LLNGGKSVLKLEEIMWTNDHAQLQIKVKVAFVFLFHLNISLSSIFCLAGGKLFQPTFVF